jgi:hypothetical protein
MNAIKIALVVGLLAVSEAAMAKDKINTNRAPSSSTGETKSIQTNAQTQKGAKTKTTSGFGFGGGSTVMTATSSQRTTTAQTNKQKWARTSRQIDKHNNSIAKQTTAKRRSLRGKPESVKN